MLRPKERKPPRRRKEQEERNNGFVNRKSKNFSSVPTRFHLSVMDVLSFTSFFFGFLLHRYRLNMNKELPWRWEEKNKMKKRNQGGCHGNGGRWWGEKGGGGVGD